jgi:hypothetical protein
MKAERLSAIYLVYLLKRVPEPGVSSVSADAFSALRRLTLRIRFILPMLLMSASMFGTTCPTGSPTLASAGCGASFNDLGIFSNLVDLGLALPKAVPGTKATTDRTRAAHRNPAPDAPSYVFVEPESSFDSAVKLAFIQAAKTASCAGSECEFTRLGEPFFVTPQNVAAWYSIRHAQSAGSAVTDPSLGDQAYVEQTLDDQTDDSSSAVGASIMNASASFSPATTDILNPAVSVVPEPGGMTLLGIGLIVLAVLRSARPAPKIAASIPGRPVSV